MKRSYKVFTTSLLALLPVLTFSALAKDFKTQTVKVATDIIVDGLDHPWGLAFLPDGALLVTERSGAMRLVNKGKLSERIANVPEVWANGQGGLLDIAVAPDFSKNNLIYFTYSQPGRGGAGTALARAKLVRNADGIKLEDVRILVSMNKKTDKGQHFGSRIVIAPDGKLFVTMGERGEQKRAQDFNDHAGSVLRINKDGSIPSDNPFADGKKLCPRFGPKATVIRKAPFGTL